jgi:IPT/TIG domain/PASTA domain
LEERLDRTQEVAGSSPASSIETIPAARFFKVLRFKARSLLGPAAVLVGLAAVSTPAMAETVTVGADLQNAVYANAFGCNVEGGCTDAEEAPGFTSPITGTIVRWRVRDSSGALTLRTVGAVGSPLGPTIHPESSAIETFPVDMPIEAGEAIGLDIAKLSGSIGVAEPGGTTLFSWTPALPPGKATPPNTTYTQFELLMNVDVQPPPGIAALTPAAGPAAGGTAVTIRGHDFTDASAVRFGSVPASTFHVESDAQITATAPAGQTGAVAVAVTTLAGTATAPFSYEAQSATPLCRVPKLKGKKLKAAKRRLRGAGCKVGKVTRKRGATPRTGRIVRQRPRAGSIRPAGAVVRIRLG